MRDGLTAGSVATSLLPSVPHPHPASSSHTQQLRERLPDAWELANEWVCFIVHVCLCMCVWDVCVNQSVWSWQANEDISRLCSSSVRLTNEGTRTRIQASGLPRQTSFSILASFHHRNNCFLRFRLWISLVPSKWAQRLWVKTPSSASKVLLLRSTSLTWKPDHGNICLLCSQSTCVQNSQAVLEAVWTLWGQEMAPYGIV